MGTSSIIDEAADRQQQRPMANTAGWYGQSGWAGLTHEPRRLRRDEVTHRVDPHVLHKVASITGTFERVH